MQVLKNFRQFDEGFEFVLAAETKEGMVERLQAWKKKSQALVPIVRMGVGAEVHDWQLPDGIPETTNIDKDIPEDMGETSITMEWRRIQQFTKANSNLNNLPQWKREQQWVNILEGIHHKEAAILTAVKDGNLLDLYPRLEEILPDIGITEYNKPSKAQETE